MKKETLVVILFLLLGTILFSAGHIYESRKTEKELKEISSDSKNEQEMDYAAVIKTLGVTVIAVTILVVGSKYQGSFSYRINR